MSIVKFYTFEDLRATGLPMIAGFLRPNVKVGEVYLTDEVICMWDFDFPSREGKYNYYEKLGERPIEHVVQICKRVSKNRYQCEMLNRDLSNLDVFKLKEETNDQL